MSRRASERTETERRRYMATRPDTDPYEVLGVPRDALLADVKRAYRRLARDHHPDRNRHDEARAEERFKEVREAFDVLSDPGLRELFDRYGNVGPEPPAKKPRSQRRVVEPEITMTEALRVAVGGVASGGGGRPRGCTLPCVERKR